MYQRIFVIVLDSLGVGAMPDSKEYGDIGVDTLLRKTQLLPAQTDTGR